MSKAKIGFLFLDNSYVIYHSIGLAIELSKSNKYNVELICSAANAKVIAQIVNKEVNQNLKIITIRPYWHFTLPHYIEIKMQFRSVLFQRYRAYLQSFDILICSLYNDLDLKNYFKKDARQPKFIFCNHGVSNGPYSFSDRIKQFDKFFMFGQNEYVKRKKLNQLTKDNHVLIGYLKMEYLENTIVRKLFDNDLKTVIYNPHWTKELSSFYKFGFKILDFFAESKKYNLIFAPHSLLTVRNKSIGLRLKKYHKLDNFIIDYESEACNDLTYVKAADLYIGDVSSQSLEFMALEPRPCIFLNAHKIVNENNDIVSWKMGRVYDQLADLDSILKLAIEEQREKYAEVQKTELPAVFYQSNQKPSALAIKAINEVLERK